LHTLVRSFRKSELGQDLAEYCLITALIALCACGIFYKVSGGMQNLWTTANTTLATNSQPASAPAAGGDAKPVPASAPADAPAK
jgi:Flp pilus assembly pilin Flp